MNTTDLTARRSSVRRALAMLIAIALLGAAATVLTPAPADAATKYFVVAGADVAFDVHRSSSSRFEVEVEIEHAHKGEKFRVTLWHNGKRYYSNTLSADGDGEIKIKRYRTNTPGSDNFKVKVRKAGTDIAKTRIIRTS